MTRKHYDRIDMLCLHINQLEKRLEVLEKIVCVKDIQSFQRLIPIVEESHHTPVALPQHDTDHDSEKKKQTQEQTKEQTQEQSHLFISRRRSVI